MDRYLRSWKTKKLTVLTRIIDECEDELICDLAETYNVLNYRELSPELVAVLSLGLKNDSRVKRHFNKSRLNLEQELLADIADSLRFICWTFSKEAHKGRSYKGKSLLKLFTEGPEKPKDELESFATIEEFNAYMKQFEE